MHICWVRLTRKRSRIQIYKETGSYVNSANALFHELDIVRNSMKNDINQDTMKIAEDNSTHTASNDTVNLNKRKALTDTARISPIRQSQRQIEKLNELDLRSKHSRDDGASKREHLHRDAKRLKAAEEAHPVLEEIQESEEEKLEEETFLAFLTQYLDGSNEATVRDLVSESQIALLNKELNKIEVIMAHALNTAEEVAGSKTPLTYSEVITGKDSDKWKESMLDEIASLESNETWELVPLPPGCKAIGSKWVYKLKIDKNGQLARFKSRVVALGYRQRKDIDFKETFAPVSNFGSIRLLLALAASKGWNTSHLDVKTAFLHGKIDHEHLYMKQPQGFVKKGKEDWVLRLKRSIYGLKQASRIWWITIHAKLEELGFKRSKRDPCLYSKITPSEVTILCLYVDDLFLATNLKSHSYCENLQKMGIDIKNLGPIDYFLGIRTERNLITGEISLDQEKYLELVLAKFGMTDCSSVPTPILESEPLTQDKSTGKQSREY
jgi:hypothetical protein